MEIWLVTLFLSRKEFHASQICVLSSSMKLDPVHKTMEILVYFWANFLESQGELKALLTTCYPTSM